MMQILAHWARYFVLGAAGVLFIAFLIAYVCDRTFRNVINIFIVVTLFCGTLGLLISKLCDLYNV